MPFPVLICNALSAFCLWVLLCSILLNFLLAKKGSIKKEKKSPVETGSMLGFFLMMVLLVAFDIINLKPDVPERIAFAVIGTAIIWFSTAVNVAGRLSLKANWGNQIRIYTDHTLVTGGIYRYIRHPLYSSTILMIYGFSFLYLNPIVFLFNTAVFLPLMIYRARQEDTLLLEAFGERFEDYRKRTGMLFPIRRKA